LPFPDESFDFVFSRVALPYMNIPDALAEIGRVLRSGGRFWTVLHSPEMLMDRVRADISDGNTRDLVFCAFVMFNSVFLRMSGKQIRIRGHCETVQTRAGFEKLLRIHGFEPLPPNHRPGQLIVEAEKKNVRLAPKRGSDATPC
jgi:SAM-dependent methyltransferase